MVLTLIAWATIVTSASKVSYDHQVKTWHSWLTFLFNKLRYVSYGDQYHHDKMKNGIAFILFILIATVVSMGVEELLDSLNQEYRWNLSERAIRWIYIAISCAIAFPLANYLSEKIKQHRK